MNVHIRILPPPAPGLDVVRGRLERITARLRSPRPARGRPAWTDGERAGFAIAKGLRALLTPPPVARDRAPRVRAAKTFNAWDLFRRRA